MSVIANSRNCNDARSSCKDWILTSYPDVETTIVTAFPPLEKPVFKIDETLWKEGRMPNANFPSDHAMLISRIPNASLEKPCLKPMGDGEEDKAEEAAVAEAGAAVAKAASAEEPKAAQAEEPKVEAGAGTATEARAAEAAEAEPAAAAGAK